MPNAIAKDVGLFMKWMVKERERDWKADRISKQNDKGQPATTEDQPASIQDSPNAAPNGRDTPATGPSNVRNDQDTMPAGQGNVAGQGHVAGQGNAPAGQNSVLNGRDTVPAGQGTVPAGQHSWFNGRDTVPADNQIHGHHELYD